MKKGALGTTLIDVVIAVTVTSLSIVALAGLLQGIGVGGNNIPRSSTSGGDNIPLVKQQVLDQINLFVVRFSRDVRGALNLSIQNDGSAIILGGKRSIARYEYDPVSSTIRKDGVPVLRGVSRRTEGNTQLPIFRQDNDSIVVNFVVQYLPQRRSGPKGLEEYPFSLVVQRRALPSSSP
ncbi:hypothetical protein [Candidatus Caldatribacterium sp.]|uniref:hypothetical protein n=1 Tax=Candidatus Caldatribacterium sp. TaxID=2282143 RepID=UPI002992CE6A|nr:hypothetical protein [Candidatus Caldatribacterium sp.]MDW8082045.1 hypothetical protein [Candidatus Calescibacterium sp.]